MYYIVVSENLNFQICALDGFQNSLLKTKKQEIRMCVKLFDPLQWAGWWNNKSNCQRRQNLGIVHYTSRNNNQWNGFIHPLLQRSKPNKNCHTERFRVYARRTDHKPVPLKHQKQLRQAILNKRCGMLTNGVQPLYDARPHTAAWTLVMVDFFGWDVIDPWLCTEWLFLLVSPPTATHSWRAFRQQGESGCIKWLREQAADFHWEGIKNLVLRHDKCLNRQGHY